MSTLRQLRYLSARARHGHFGRAAEAYESGALAAAMLALPVAEPNVETLTLFEDLFLLADALRRSAPGDHAGCRPRYRSKPVDPARRRPLPERSGAGVVKQ
jgi:hypothetical protein